MKPERFAADTAYGSAALLDSLDHGLAEDCVLEVDDAGVEPGVPVAARLGLDPADLAVEHHNLLLSCLMSLMSPASAANLSPAASKRASIFAGNPASISSMIFFTMRGA